MNRFKHLMVAACLLAATSEVAMRVKLIATVTSVAVLLLSVKANAQFTLPGGLPGIPGLSSAPNIGKGVAGALIAIAMSEMLKKLSQAEKKKRRAALNKAARSGSASWSSSGRESKKASYKAAGPIQETNGKKCQKVSETITLSSGKQATSTETVCFS